MLFSWKSHLFYAWLILAMQNCCFCKIDVTCYGEGLPVRFLDGCCQNRLDSTYLTRYELANPANRKTLRLPRQSLQKLTGDQPGYEFDLSQTLSEIRDPNSNQKWDSEYYSDYEGKNTQLLPRYGFILKNRPAGFEYQITGITLESFSLACASSGECLRTQSFLLNGALVTARELRIKQ